MRVESIVNELVLRIDKLLQKRIKKHGDQSEEDRDSSGTSAL